MGTVTCRCHQRAEAQAHALHLQVHDGETTCRHQLFQLFSQLQGRGQSERTAAGRGPSVSPHPDCGLLSSFVL